MHESRTPFLPGQDRGVDGTRFADNSRSVGFQLSPALPDRSKVLLCHFYSQEMHFLTNLLDSLIVLIDLLTHSIEFLMNSIDFLVKLINFREILCTQMFLYAFFPP